MLALLSGIWQCFLILSLGALFSQRFRSSPRLGEFIALSTGIGIVILSALISLLLLTGLFRPAFVIPLFLVLTVFSARAGYPLVTRGIRGLREAVRANPVLACIAGLLLLPQLLSGLTPEVEVDSLWYHLGVPQFYLFHARLCEVPFHLPSHYPMNFHLQYVFSLLVGNDLTAKVLIVFLFFPVCTLIYSLTRHRSNRSAAFLAVIVYLSMIHHRVPVMTNAQRAVLLFTLLSTAFLWRWMEAGNSRDFWISAFWCGVAMGTKFNALIFCLLLHSGAAALWMLLRRDWRGLIPRILGYQAVAWLLLSPWMIKSFLFTGNPLYPLLSGLFGAREEYLQAMLSNDRNHGVNFTRSDSIQEFIRQVLHNIDWMLHNSDLLFCLVPFVLLLLCIQMRRYAPQILSGVVALPLFTFLWGSDVGRLFGLTYGMFSILTGLGLFTLQLKRRAGIYVFWLVAIGLPVTFLVQKAIFCHYPAIDWHGDIHLSSGSRLNFLVDHNILNHEDLEVYRFVEGNLSKDINLYVYHGGYPFYMQFPKILTDAHFQFPKGDMLDQWLAEQGAEEAARRLQELNVGYLLRGRKTGWKSVNEKEKASQITRDGFDVFIQRYAHSLRKFDQQEIFQFRWTDEPC